MEKGQEKQIKQPTWIYSSRVTWYWEILSLVQTFMIKRHRSCLKNLVFWLVNTMLS